MKINGFLCVSTFILASFAVPLGAAAQAPVVGADPEAQARTLFQEAIVEMGAQNYASACPKLEESIQLVPRASGGHMAMARCYEATGRLASAWNEYVTAEPLARVAGNEERAIEAASNVARLKSLCAVLVLRFDETFKASPWLTIKIDGVSLDLARARDGFPIDKGIHAVVVSGGGHEPQTMRVDITKDGTRTTLKVPTLKRPSSPPPPPPTTPSRSKVPAFVLGGLGVAGLVAGGALVGVAVGTPGTIDAKLPLDDKGNSLCTREPRVGESGVCAELRSTAQSGSTLGNVGVGMLVGGGVLVGAGVVYLLIPSKTAAGKKRSSTVLPAVSSEGGGVLWTGSF